MSQPQTIHYMQFGHAACLIPGVPGRDWPDNHVWSPDPKEVTCSACLQGMKYGESTFEILEEGKAIRCRRCGMISYSPKDVENHWCGRCKASHDDIWPPARLAWVKSYAIPS